MAETDTDTSAAAALAASASAAAASAYTPQPDMIMSYPPNLGIGGGKAIQQQLHSVQFTIIAREESRLGAAALAAGTGTYHGGEGITIEDGAGAALLTPVLALAGAGFVGKDPLAALGALGAAFVTANLTETSVEEMAGTIKEWLNSVFVPNRRVKTKNVINLHISQSPQEQYSAGWSDVEFGLAGAYMDSPGENFITDIATAFTSDGAARDRLIRKIAGMANLTSAAGFDFKLQDGIDLQTGQVPNPYKEQLFKSMDFRTFAFQFKFAPKNNYELKMAYAIINTFRQNMHPERSNDKFFIMYPSEFAIEYQYKNQKNKWLTKIADCALVDMKVDFGAGGTFNSIQSTAGAPTEMTMTLQFKETTLLTAQHFDDNPFDAPADEGFAFDGDDGNNPAFDDEAAFNASTFS